MMRSDKTTLDDVEYRGGLTLVQVAVLVSLVAIGAVLVVACQTGVRTPAVQTMNSSQLRGIHQSLVIHSQSNNYHMAGLDRSGEVIPDGPLTGWSGDGASPAARFWILVDRDYIPLEMLIHPKERPGKMWTTGAMSPSFFAYTMLAIGTPRDAIARRSEWHDKANSEAVLLADRNTSVSSADAAVQSVFTTTPGDWKGNAVWGDNHGTFLTTHKLAQSKYGDVTTTNDNLFRDEQSTGGHNALMVR